MKAHNKLTLYDYLEWQDIGVIFLPWITGNAPSYLIEESYEILQANKKWFQENFWKELIIPDISVLPKHIGFSNKIKQNILHKIGDDKQYIVVGHSMGWLLAMDLYNDIQDQIKYIITLSTPHHPERYSKLHKLFAGHEINKLFNMIEKIKNNIHQAKNIYSFWWYFDFMVPTSVSNYDKSIFHENFYVSHKDISKKLLKILWTTEIIQDLKDKYEK